MTITPSETADCQCPRCGRMHRDLQAGRPPEGIAYPSPIFERMEKYAARFEHSGKPQHAEVIRSWIAALNKSTTDTP